MPSTIYELPTRSPRKYRGKYPSRVNSWSAGRAGHAVHFELNNGRRFVALPASVEQPVKLNVHISRALKPIGLIPTMSHADYAGILFIVRLTRWLRTTAPHGLPFNPLGL